MSLAVTRGVADARGVRWLACLVVLAAEPASADGEYAAFLFGGGDLGGDLDDRMGGAGRLRVVSGRRYDGWAREETLTWDGGGDGEAHHNLVGYSLAKKRFKRMSEHVALYARGSFGLVLLDGAQVGPSVGLATGAQVQAPVEKYSLTLSVIVEVGAEASYLLPAELDATFAYYLSGFAIGVPFD